MYYTLTIGVSYDSYLFFPTQEATPAVSTSGVASPTRKEASLMARVTPEEFQEKHARRLKASVTDIQRGVERITVSPTEQAAKKKDKMRQNINEAIDNGRWERNLRKVSLEEWRQKMVSKGLPRISTGIDGAADKMRDFASQLLPHIDAGRQIVGQMPDLTLDDSLARVTTYIRHMSKFKKR